MRTAEITRRGATQILVAAGIGAISAAIRPTSVASAERGWIPIEMPDRRRLIVQGAIDNIPARLLLDTGAGRLAIDRAFAAKINISEQSAFVATDLGGNASGATGGAATIDVSGAKFTAPRTAIVDLGVINAVLPQPIAAVVGRDFFENFAVDFDFMNRRLRLLPPASGQGREIILGHDNYHLRTIEIRIGDRTPIPALVDLGADRPLYLSPAYVAGANVLEGVKTSSALSGGVSGIQLSTVAVLDEISINDLVFQQVPIEVPPTWTFNAPAVVGLPVWRRLEHAIFDFADDAIRLPASAVSDEPFRKDRSGLGVMPDQKGLRVLYVAPGSPADEAGLMPGTTIVAVNGARCDRAYLRTHGRDGAQPAGTVLHMTLDNASTVTLRLADYF